MLSFAAIYRVQTIRGTMKICWYCTFIDSASVHKYERTICPPDHSVPLLYLTALQSLRVVRRDSLAFQYCCLVISPRTHVARDSDREIAFDSQFAVCSGLAAFRCACHLCFARHMHIIVLWRLLIPCGQMPVLLGLCSHLR